MKYKRLIAGICAAATLLSGLSGCSKLPSEEDLTYTDTLFDTVISVQVLDPADQEILDGCKELCHKYDALFSKTNENSDIYKINHAKGKAVEVSEDTITLIEKGIYYSELSGGIFDITIGSVSNLWDFKSEKPKVPSSKKLKSAVSHVNYKNIMLKDNTVRLTDKHARLDVGAIAKGYIADRIKEYLEKSGVRHAIINLGGNVQTIGGKTDGSAYNIGIQKPFDESGTAITSVKIKDQSIVTTGVYQRYFESKGQLYHHILSPKTGKPCENSLFSVSIITDSSLTADALSTVCFLMGYKKGMKLVNQLENVDAVFITDDYKIHYSDNFLK